MKIKGATLLLCLLLVLSCKKITPIDDNTYTSESTTTVDTNNISNQNNNKPQYIEYTPIKQPHKRNRNDYDPEDFICPECGEEKEEDEELCYDCNEELERKNKEVEEEENEEEDE
jgi:hypothetical protein